MCFGALPGQSELALPGRPASCVIYINPALYHALDGSQVNVTLLR